MTRASVVNPRRVRKKSYTVGLARERGEARLIPVRRLGHVTFETPDIEKQIDHYTGIVGLIVAAQQKGRAVLATRLGEEALVLERGPRERTTAVSFQVDAEFEMTRGRK